MELLPRTPARRRLWVLLLLFGVLAPLPAAAQESGVVGTVRDPSGAVVAGADIALTNTQTGEVRRATTDDSGRARFRTSRPPSTTSRRRKPASRSS